IAGICPRSDREVGIDFSHPTTSASMSLLVKCRQRSWLEAFKFHFEETGMAWLMLFLFVVISAHAVWILERGVDSDISTEYRKGIDDAAWFSFVVLTTNGFADKMPKRSVTRWLAVIIVVGGLYFVANIAASMTKAKLETSLISNLRVVSDVVGKRAA